MDRSTCGLSGVVPIELSEHKLYEYDEREGDADGDSQFHINGFVCTNDQIYMKFCDLSLKVGDIIVE